MGIMNAARSPVNFQVAVQQGSKIEGASMLWGSLVGFHDVVIVSRRNAKKLYGSCDIMSG